MAILKMRDVHFIILKICLLALFSIMVFTQLKPRPLFVNVAYAVSLVLASSTFFYVMLTFNIYTVEVEKRFIDNLKINEK